VIQNYRYHIEHKFNKFILVLSISIIGTVFLSGCAYSVFRYDGPYKGKVIDADTGEPIEGVVVLGVWYKAHWSPAGATHTFYDAKETVTDRNGDFKISGMGIEVFSNVEPMNFLIFKAGYEYLGMGPWKGLKVGYRLSKIVKWEGKRAIIPIRKLSLEESRKQGTPSRPNIPIEEMRLMTQEINKSRRERGLDLL
jgi:hypothetical protein